MYTYVFMYFFLVVDTTELNTMGIQDPNLLFGQKPDSHAG